MTYPSDLRALALSSARAHAADLGGTFVVLAAAGAVTSLTGALVESGLRGDGGGALVALASSFAGTALVVTLLVVTSTVTLALRQRRRELALLRAVGATAGQVRRLVSLETAVVTLVAVPLGAVPALWGPRVLSPLLEQAGMVPAGFAPSLSPLPVAAAVLLVLPVAALAGRLATREVLSVPPTTAVRTSIVEAHGIGRVRAACAAALAISGLSSALTPLLVPGTAGAAAAGTSALLLVAASACAGPALVGTAFGAGRRLAGRRQRQHATRAVQRPRLLPPDDRRGGPARPGDQPRHDVGGRGPHDRARRPRPARSRRPRGRGRRAPDRCDGAGGRGDQQPAGRGRGRDARHGPGAPPDRRRAARRTGLGGRTAARRGPLGVGNPRGSRPPRGSDRRPDASRHHRPEP